ncbi:hypothetical protein [Helicobacter sp. 12S02232-10]|uniref:hypothetical protein n=1 Tax=Helicobacter sp. 12S02232-10 TaxID=1476197 RepID=UPI0015DF70C9|nr:hypothetical protein [Helicobacter sp. 12S02232-10]
MKIILSTLALALVFYGCAQKKLQIKKNITAIKCETFCKANECHQKCIGIAE